MTELVAPELRRTILVISDHDYRTALEDADLVDLFDDYETRVVRLTRTESEDPLVPVLRAQGLLRPGTVAVQSPYNTERYVPAEAALVELAAERLVKVTQIAHMLGAREIQVTDIRADRSRTRSTLDARANLDIAMGEGSVEHEVQDALTRKIQVKYSFGPREADPDGAMRLLLASGLGGDAQLRGLIDFRSPPNKLTSYELHFSGTQESAANLRLALRVSEGVWKLKLAEASIEFRRQVESHVEVEIVTSIKF